jgi:hypothetical protein
MTAGGACTDTLGPFSFSSDFFDFFCGFCGASMARTLAAKIQLLARLKRSSDGAQYTFSLLLFIFGSHDIQTWRTRTAVA